MRNVLENGDKLIVPYLYNFETRGRFVGSFIPNPLDWRLVGLRATLDAVAKTVISEILFVCNFGVLPEEQRRISRI
jgi:hypothetical protein